MKPEISSTNKTVKITNNKVLENFTAAITGHLDETTYATLNIDVI